MAGLGKGYSVQALVAAKEVRGNRNAVLAFFCVAGFGGKRFSSGPVLLTSRFQARRV